MTVHHHVYHGNQTNGLAMAGLIFSTLGWVTCGLLCLLGAPLSFLGLFSRGPKGLAVAGLIVGFPGVLFFVFVGSTILFGFLGLGAAATATVAEADRRAKEEKLRQTPASIDLSSSDSPDLGLDFGPQLESQPDLEPEIADQPDPVTESRPADGSVEMNVEPPMAEVQPELDFQPTSEPKTEMQPSVLDVPRTFGDSEGRFSVEAIVLGFADGMVKLQRVDNDKEISVPFERFSDSDQQWIQENVPQDYARQQ